MNAPLLTVHETAAQLKVKDATIRAWIREKKLRAFKFGREWRVDQKDLQTFVNKRANFAAE